VSAKKNDKKFVNIIKATDLIILDEVSMCSPLILDTFDEVLRATTMNRNHLFGGKRVILCGDIAQLPPVVREEEAKFLSDEFGYEDMSPMSSKVFKEITVVELKGSYRQRDDQDFADTLNYIRMARMGNLEKCLILELNQKLFGMNNQCYLKKPEEEAVCLVYTNKEASSINEKKIARIGGSGSTYFANEQGSWKSGNSRAAPELYLKPGVRVVCIANIKGMDIYNGDTGVVVSTGVDHVRICVDRTGDIECITPYTWESIEYEFKPGKGFTTQVTGKLTQIPLLLAYACTIHSSQGTTLEKVHIPKFSGMDSALIYVALSRAQRMDDLSFGEPLYIDKFVGNGLARSYRYRRPKRLSDLRI
jgi:ATP-dependent exoDNAse (exonuclease V) alpha subunit